MRAEAEKKSIKYRDIYEKIYANIATGQYEPGEMLPTERELSKLYNISRPTVGRALRDLESRGVVSRKRGSGTFVRKFANSREKTFGILFPNSVVNSMGVSANLNDTFGIIIPEMSNSASEFGYSLMLNRLPKGEAEELAKNARLVCEQLIDLQVAGVVFMPLEMPAHLLGINAEIAAMFDRAGINVVLVDRDICPPAKRSKYDIVAIDHEKAAYMLTLHLVDIGWKKIDFVSYQFSSASMIQRFNGYQNALRESGLAYDKSRLHIIEDTKNVDAIRKTVRELDTDALVCVNDEIAVMMMNQMSQCGIQVPRDMRIVGFDDSPILTHFHLPLTTVRQPVRELGDEAIRALLFRKANPAGPARTTMLATQLIVRDSCGSKMFGKK